MKTNTTALIIILVAAAASLLVLSARATCAAAPASTSGFSPMPLHQITLYDGGKAVMRWIAANDNGDFSSACVKQFIDANTGLAVSTTGTIVVEELSVPKPVFQPARMTIILYSSGVVVRTWQSVNVSFAGTGQATFTDLHTGAKVAIAGTFVVEQIEN
jgi:hypothetical protein